MQGLLHSALEVTSLVSGMCASIPNALASAPTERKSLPYLESELCALIDKEQPKRKRDI